MGRFLPSVMRPISRDVSQCHALLTARFFRDSAAAGGGAPTASAAHQGPCVFLRPAPFGGLSLNLACRNLCPDFSATFTTITFDNRSLRWLEINT